jgi:hypothetical protein
VRVQYVAQLRTNLSDGRSPAAAGDRTYSDDNELYELERTAKAERRGLWSLPEFERVSPWEHRNGSRPEERSADAVPAFQRGLKRRGAQGGSRSTG